MPGCATGEEAFSLAMLFQEDFERRGVSPRLIIFATDLDESALTIAREGLYPLAIADDVSEARLARFFRLEDDRYRVLPVLRDCVVFASHSLLRDPPFSRVQLVSCRNVLIYLDHELQNQVMSVFRYALADPGFLFLGSSEVADDAAFEPLDKKHRVYAARPRPDGLRRLLPDILAVPLPGTARPGRDGRAGARSAPAEMHAAALEAAAPPSVLVDERWGVVHVSPSASVYFQQSSGPLARRLTDLVRPELRDELHALLHRAADSHDPQLSSFITVGFDGGQPRRLALLVQPAPTDTGHLLVTFLDAGVTVTSAAPPGAVTDSDEVRALRDQLRHAEQRIETIRDDQHLTTEDLRAANEELQSLNEEYRSTTEELETSKEELQSINEELQTVNQELKLKLEEVSHAHNDLENLMAATEVATLFLGADLRIKRFTPQLEEIFSVKARDVGRPIDDLTHGLDYQHLADDARQVLADAVPVRREATSRDGRSFTIRLSPYRTAATPDVVGVVITFIDVTTSKATERALRQSEQQLEGELRAMRRLHRMTLEMATASLPEALQGVLDAAIELHGADCGHIQLADASLGGYRVAAHRGFTRAHLATFGTASTDDGSSCAGALRSRRPCQVGDVLDQEVSPAVRDAALDGGFRGLQAMPLVGADDEVIGVLSVFFRDPHVFGERDIQIGDMLAAHAASLVAARLHQDRVARLNEILRVRTSELESSQDRLSRQTAQLLEESRHREAFLAALGHELRNPVAAIHSSLPLIEVSDDRSIRAREVVSRQTRHLTRLINDLLDVTRVTQGRLRLDLAPIDVTTSVLAAVEAVRPQGEANGLALTVVAPGVPLVVDADQERLAQVLDNLLRNAITYTDDGGVTVTIEDAAPMERIVVRDTGIGIDDSRRALMFTPQQRDLPRRGGGLGLGLTVVKGLIEAHGGTIWFESEGAGRGTAFIFTLPLARRPLETVAPAVLRSTSSHRVLVVDDQPDVADMFAALLEAMGQSVRVAYNATDALQLAREHRPRVAFLDVSMPDVSGAELARRLRAEYGAGDLTLVAVTGFDTSHREMAGSAFDQHLLKPASLEAVSAVLDGLNPAPPA